VKKEGSTLSSKVQKTIIIQNIPEDVLSSPTIELAIMDHIDDVWDEAYNIDTDESQLGNLPGNWGPENDDTEEFKFGLCQKLSEYGDLFSEGHDGLLKLVTEYHKDFRENVIEKIINTGFLLDISINMSYSYIHRHLVNKEPLQPDLDMSKYIERLNDMSLALDGIMWGKYYYANFIFTDWNTNYFKNVMTNKELSEINPGTTYVIKMPILP
jgi:hypothetical protein